MDRKRLDVNDYQNASDEFKKEVAFANDVLDKVYAKIGKAMKVDNSRLGSIVHSSENIIHNSIGSRKLTGVGTDQWFNESVKFEDHVNK